MKINILGVKVDKTSEEDVLVKIAELLDQGKKFFIVTPNPEIILEARKDKNFQEVLNSADIAIPDGVGLKLADFGLSVIKGRNLMERLFRVANDYKLKVYLLGATQIANKKAVELGQKKYPNMKILGSSGFLLTREGLAQDSNEKAKEAEVISEINKFSPDILFVGFGAPKQEMWVSRHLGDLKIGGAMTVGGSFDYFVSGAKVPEFLSVTGLEWLFRLVREPKRIFRIFNAVVVFPLTLLVYKIIK